MPEGFHDYEGALCYFYGFARYGSRRRARPRTLRTLLHACGVSAVRHVSKVVQITGTNGKGSVCAGVEQILLSWGEATVCLTSPHIHSVRDRIRVCGHPISKQQFCELLMRLSPILERVRGTRLHLRPMQIVTLMALVLHAELGEECCGIYEVGMGGRYDSTNVFTRSIVGLCTINDDHLEEFGGSLVSLAEEKIGLCSPGSTLFSQEQVEPVLDMIKEYCRKWNVQRLSPSKLVELPTQSQIPPWSLDNMALAWSLALHLVPQRDPRKDGRELLSLLHKSRLPRRFEERTVYNRFFLLDGAHNRQAVETLLGHLENLKSLKAESMVAIVGFSASKDWLPMLQRVMTSPVFGEIVFTQATRPRGVEPWRLAVAASTVRKCRFFPSLKSALDWSLNSNHQRFVIFGSLLMAADFDKALQALGLEALTIDVNEIDPQQPWMHPLV